MDFYPKEVDWRYKATEVADISVATVETELLRLFDSGCTESEIQKYLENHCYVLLQSRNSRSHTALVTQPRLADDFVGDFVMFGGCNDYWLTMVEIEKPSDRLFTNSGDYSKAFSHALRQIADWKAWISTNTSLFASTFSASSANFEIIIGRRAEHREHAHKLKAFDPSITISSFDSLLPKLLGNSMSFSPKVQKEAVTFSEYKNLYANRLGSSEAFQRPDPWFLYWTWDK